MAGTAKKKKSKLRGWLGYLLVFLSSGGAGVGGWSLTGHPILSHIVGVVKEKAADGDASDAIKAGLKEGLKEGLTQVLASNAESFKQSGPYEVRLAQVSLDDAIFPEGQVVNVVVRVLRRDVDGQETLLWTSRNYGDRMAVAGKDELTFRWPDQPFEVDWKPGDHYVLEVWNHKTLRSRKLFEYNAAADDEFPLKTGKRPLVAQAGGKAEASCVVFESKRIKESRPDPAGTARVAERDRTRTVR